MEVEGNILPVDLRIEEIAVREIAKIQSKNIAEPVKQQYWRNISFLGQLVVCCLLLPLPLLLAVLLKSQKGGFTLSTRLIVLVSCCNVDL
jgi:hypothetical protein